MLLPASGRWRRAFYWHQRPEPDFGVLTFEGSGGGLPRDIDPVWVATRALATLLGADLVGEDEMAYEK